MPAFAWDTWAAPASTPSPRTTCCRSSRFDGTFPILFASDKLVLGVGLGWDYDGRSVRQDASSAHRFYVPVEARYAVLPWLHPFLKLAPGATVAIALFPSESTLERDMSATGWAFAADASIGTSILLGPRKHMEWTFARVWLTPENGYAHDGGEAVGRDGARRRECPRERRANELAFARAHWTLLASVRRDDVLNTEQVTGITCSVF